MEQGLPFRIFSNCIPVKGSNRSTICDLQRNKIHLIPNSLYEILSESQGFTIAQIKMKYDGEYNEIIDEYFLFLEQEELIFFTANPEWFPDLSMHWDYPFMISNCIIDIDENSTFEFSKIFDSLNVLNCRFLEVRGYSAMSLNFYKSLLEFSKHTTVSSIGLIVKNNENISLLQWKQLCDKYNRVTSLVIHSCTKTMKDVSLELGTPMQLINKVLQNETCCGVVNEGYFRAYADVFTESLKYNSCLNRKVSIDRKGNIKNCPSLKLTFGNVQETTIVDAVKLPEFTKYWNVTKDQIDICKDCEFRYVCTDCRAYVEDPNNVYSKPIKCGYDPYTCEWEDWSLNPIKQKVIKFYGFQN